MRGGWAGMAGLAVGLALAVTALARQPDGEQRPGRHDTSRLATRDVGGKTLARLLAALWPLRLEGFAAETSGIDWAEADRRYVWTRALFASAGRSWHTLAARGIDGAPGRNDHARTTDTERQDLTIEADNAGQPNPAAALAEALGAIDAGMAASPPAADVSEARARRSLSWPVIGPGAVRTASPGGWPKTGLFLATDEGCPVVAAASGQVEYSGLLRGLGHVVIVSHDAALRTVYACLASSEVFVGDRVARDGRLGAAGRCDVSRQSGIYFELRFREKALNPAEWFAARP